MPDLFFLPHSFATHLLAAAGPIRTGTPGHISVETTMIYNPRFGVRPWPRAQPAGPAAACFVPDRWQSFAIYPWTALDLDHSATAYPATSCRENITAEQAPITCQTHYVME